MTITDALAETLTVHSQLQDALDAFWRSAHEHGNADKLPGDQCSLCKAARAKIEELFTELTRQRRLLAQLSAPTPQFFNPLHAFEAQAIRDAVLQSMEQGAE